MVLFSLSTIWGLGYIYFYPRFNSQGNDPCKYSHPEKTKREARPVAKRTVCTFKHKTEGPRTFVTRRGAPSNLAKTTGIWMEGDERTCFSIHNIIKMSVRLMGWRQGRARGATAPPRRRKFWALVGEIWQNIARQHHFSAILAPMSEASAPLSENFWSHPW